MPAYEIL